MKRIAIYLFLVVALMLINQKAEASSKNILGICLTGKSYSWNYNIEKDSHGKNYHKAFKDKSLSKIKKKLKCETFFIDKDASPELYSVITKKLILFDDFFYLRKTDFNKLNKEFGILGSSSEMAATESTGLAAKLERIEQEYLDGLISNRECVKKKKRAYAGGVKEFGDLSVPGYRKSKKVIAKKKKDKTGRAAKLESVEQMYSDGLINKKQCLEDKKKILKSDTIAVPGCRKSKKLIADE